MRTWSRDTRIRAIARSAEKRRRSMPEYRKGLILLLLEDQGEITAEDAVELLDVSRNVACELLRGLELEGKIYAYSVSSRSITWRQVVL